MYSCLSVLLSSVSTSAGIAIGTDNGGAAWRQTIFYPFMLASAYGRGTALRAITDCEHYTSSDRLDVPYVDASVIDNKEKREITVFALNRALEEDMELSLVLEGYTNAKMTEHLELYSDDLKATNTRDGETVAPKACEISKTVGEAQSVTLKKHSWNVIRFTY